MALTIYSDLCEHLLDFAGDVDPQGLALRQGQRAVQLAMNVIPQLRRWAYLYSPYLQVTNASQNSSTLTYTHTGGASERMATIAAGTWPTWAALGVLRIGQVDYEVATRESSTVITLSRNSNPGADVAALSAYTLYRNQYPLPTDFLSMGGLFNRTNGGPLEYVQPNDAHMSGGNVGPSTPSQYTIMGSRNYLNTMTLFLWPAPGTAITLDGLYQRRMRPVLVQDYNTGTVTCSAASTTITGNGTTFTSKMVGSVLRLGLSTTDAPTGLGGAYPFECERVITAYTSATSITVDAVPDATYTAVKYRLSDPIDVRENVMLTLLLRECEKQFRLLRRMEPTKDERIEYEAAKQLAYESDSPTFEAQEIGQGAGLHWMQVSQLYRRLYPG